MTHAAVHINNASKQFTRTTALHPTTLHLQYGESIALAGHNGAGKSTLIKLILGLTRPSTGNILLFGKTAHSKAAILSHKHIGYLPETAILHPALTGIETLNFFARLKQLPTHQNQALLERVGISQAAQDRVGTYSKGMRQRLALAQALLGQPKALLLDEPTTGLDPTSRLLFYDIVHELRNQGAMVLLCTHALAEIEGRTDRIIMMKNGRIVADGSSAALRQQALLPIKITVEFSAHGPVPELHGDWHEIGPQRYEHYCSEQQKITILQAVLTLQTPPLDLQVQTASLEETYAHLLLREDI